MADSKKAFMAAMLCLLLASTAELSFTSLAKANPNYLPNHQIPHPNPVTDKPTISLVIPTDNATIQEDKITIVFSVNMPDSWIYRYSTTSGSPYTSFIGRIRSVACSLDGVQILNENVTREWLDWKPDTYNWTRFLNFGQDINSLSLGQHTLMMQVGADTIYAPTGGFDWYFYDVSTSATFTFMVSPPTPTPSPSPSPTPSTSPSPSPSSPPQEPIFSMPKEYLNYTITERDDAPWAIIDGVYPIYYSNANNFENISMVYPTPPGTTNITITVNGTNLSWSNFTEQFPTALHHTVLGDWAMIAAEFTPSPFFTLAIHYEHPIIQTNGTYQFLYDLNIASYLSASSPNSTAYFKVKTETPLSNLKIYTVPNDNDRNEQSYTTQTIGAQQEVTFEVTSEYNKPLPGDILFTFSNDEAVQDSVPITWIAVPIITIVVLATAALVYLKRRRKL